MIFLLECIAACALFALVLELMAARREVFTNDYPPVVTDKLRALQLVAETPPTKKSDIVRKAVATVIFALLFALVLRFINGITTFLQAACTAYLL